MKAYGNYRAKAYNRYTTERELKQSTTKNDHKKGTVSQPESN